MKRQVRILDLIQQIWEINPKFRIGQIIAWAHDCSKNAHSSLFYLEDIHMEESLKYYLGELRKDLKLDDHHSTVI